MRIASVGEITIDHYLDLGREYIGGISLNFAVHARRCGADTAIVSCVGDDGSGQLALAKLRSERVDASHVQVHAGATARQDITVTEQGERIFPLGGYHASVLAQWQPSDEDLAYIRGFDVVAVPYFAQIAHIFDQVVGNQHFTGRRVADLLDWSDERDHSVNLEVLLSHLDLAFVSGDQRTIATLQPLSHRCPIIVTLGAHGSAALVTGDVMHQDAVAGPAPIDTTGCGDAFGAAFTVAYFEHGDVRRALAAGAQQAALVTQYYGASDII